MQPLPALAPLEMTVPAADGVVLKGQLSYPAAFGGLQHPLAILAHQYPATRDSFAPLVVDLLALGVATLAFDLRGHGASIQSPNGPLVIDTPNGLTLAEFGTAFMSSVEKVGFHRIADDVMRVAGWGVSQNFIDPSRIFLIGASVGGSGALLAAPRFTGLRGVLTLAAAGALAFGAGTPAHIRTGLASLGAPVLLASSEGDAFDGAANVRDWSDGLDHVTPLLVPGTGHGMAIYYDVRDEVVEFIKGRA